jgi:hypothetical protein
MANQAETQPGSPSISHPMVVVLAWLGVGLPLLWGIEQTVHKALALFELAR